MEEDKALRELKGSNADMAAEKQDSKRIIIVFEKDGITNRLFIFSKDRESAIEWFRSLSYIRYKRSQKYRITDRFIFTIVIGILRCYIFIEGDLSFRSVNSQQKERIRSCQLSRIQGSSTARSSPRSPQSDMKAAL